MLAQVAWRITLSPCTDHNDPVYVDGVSSSRDSILHISDKVKLFSLFFKWLKPGGRLLFTDYNCADGPLSDEFKAYQEQRGYAIHIRVVGNDYIGTCLTIHPRCSRP